MDTVLCKNAFRCGRLYPNLISSGSKTRLCLSHLPSHLKYSDSSNLTPLTFSSFIQSSSLGQPTSISHLKSCFAARPQKKRVPRARQGRAEPRRHPPAPRVGAWLCFLQGLPRGPFSRGIAPEPGSPASTGGRRGTPPSGMPPFPLFPARPGRSRRDPAPQQPRGPVVGCVCGCRCVGVSPWAGRRRPGSSAPPAPPRGGSCPHAATSAPRWARPRAARRG